MNITLNEPFVLNSKSTLIGQTYGLMSVGLILAAAASSLSLHEQFSTLTAIIAFIGAIVAMFGAISLKDSVVGLMCYFGFTGLMGYITGPAIQHYLEMPNGPTVVLQALSATAITTVGLSIYAFVSGKSFNQIGGFLFAGLWIVIGAGIANMFLQSRLFDLVISGVSALIFCGYILYDTGRIIKGEIDSPIEGAISMFLNVMNLFLDLLRLFSSNGD